MARSARRIHAKRIARLARWCASIHTNTSTRLIRRSGSSFAIRHTRSDETFIRAIRLRGCGTWLTMRWVTGLIGFAGIAGVMTYPARKQIYRKRAGALRYWLLAHVYLGVLAAIALLIHGGSHSGGLLTLILMLWFDATILTGLFGVLCYVIVPRIMTSIEGDPLLIEDLEGRRAELQTEMSTIEGKMNDETRRVVQSKVRKHFLSLGYLVKEYTR